MKNASRFFFSLFSISCIFFFFSCQPKKAESKDWESILNHKLDSLKSTMNKNCQEQLNAEKLAYENALTRIRQALDSNTESTKNTKLQEVVEATKEAIPKGKLIKGNNESKDQSSLLKGNGNSNKKKSGKLIKGRQ